MKVGHLFSRLAETVAHASGRPVTFALSVSIILLWALTGPLFGFSDTWQLIINTVTTLVTFLMVFLIQNTQNRDATAVHAKLDELVRVGKARNTLIGLEHLDDTDVERARREIERLRSRSNPGEADELVDVREKIERARSRRTGRRANRRVRLRKRNIRPPASRGTKRAAGD